MQPWYALVLSCDVQDNPICWCDKNSDLPKMKVSQKIWENKISFQSLEIITITCLFSPCCISNLMATLLKIAHQLCRQTMQVISPVTLFWMCPAKLSFKSIFMSSSVTFLGISYYYVKWFWRHTLIKNNISAKLSNLSQHKMLRTIHTSECACTRLKPRLACHV